LPLLPIRTLPQETVGSFGFQQPAKVRYRYFPPRIVPVMRSLKPGRDQRISAAQ
jgi:hypothetical protein